MDIVKVEGLRKNYGKLTALDGLTFTADKGEIYGIIGPDGAGKTTLLRILATLLLADEGTATVEGYDVKTDYRMIRRNIGYMPGSFSLYQDLTVEENLKFFASVFNVSINDNYGMVEDIYRQISPFKKRRAGKLSGGMKQKLALCCALIHAPQVLLLDEPTTGVDPVSRREFWSSLLKLRADYDITILVSTPYMDEASWCDRISLIQSGQFMQTDTPEGICRKYSEALLSVRSNDMHRLLSDLKACRLVKNSFAFGNSYHVILHDDASPELLTAALAENGHNGIKIEKILPSVEDCFMSLMKNATR